MYDAEESRASSSSSSAMFFFSKIISHVYHGHLLPTGQRCAPPIVTKKSSCYMMSLSLSEVLFVFYFEMFVSA